MIILGLLSHFIADFLLQSKRLISGKKDKIILNNLFHCFIVFITAVIVFSILLIYDGIDGRKFLLYVLPVLLLYSIIHFLIDLFKSLILKYKENNPNWDLALFLIDQILHIISIFVLFRIVNIYVYLNNKFNVIIIIILLYLLVVYVGDITIRKILRVLNIKKDSEDIKGIGSYIGKIERIIILTMMMLDQPEIALAIIGTKSIARFPEISKKDGTNSNDYYVLGNLLSLLIVMIGYVLYQFVLR